jgi:hypothetical protein
MMEVELIGIGNSKRKRGDRLEDRGKFKRGVGGGQGFPSKRDFHIYFFYGKYIVAIWNSTRCRRTADSVLEPT